MSTIINDGTGSGKSAKVSGENRLQTQAISESLQHHISRHNGEAYQVLGLSTVASGANTVLHVRNNSQTLVMTITFLRMQAVDLTGGTVLPSANTYWNIALGRTRDSGGTEVTPVNMNTGSKKTADITAYSDNPVLAGTASVMDREYVKEDGLRSIFNKDGSVILEPGGTMEITLQTDHAGVGCARISFLMINPVDFT